MHKSAFAKLLTTLSCFVLAVVAGFILLNLSSTPVAADPAIVVRDVGPCGMPGSDANGNIILGGIGTSTHVMENDNKVSLTCKGTNLVNLSGSGQHFSGFGCGIISPSGQLFITADTHATVSASGNGTLTCTAKKP